MEPAEERALARSAYEALEVPRPNWDQLGEGELGTRGAWLDKVRRATNPSTMIHGYVVMLFASQGHVCKGEFYATLQQVALNSTLSNGRGQTHRIDITTTFELLQWAQANPPKRERKRVIDPPQESDHHAVITTGEATTAAERPRIERRKVVDVPRRERKRIRDA